MEKEREMMDRLDSVRDKITDEKLVLEKEVGLEQHQSEMQQKR